MPPTFPLGEWLPDLGAVDLPGLKDVRNVYPTASGWRMFPTDIGGTVTDGVPNHSLGGICIGAKSGRVREGTTYIIAGAANGRVYLSRNGGAFVQDAGLFGVPPLGRWVFEQYDTTVLGTNGVDPPQEMDLTDVTPAFASVSADAPFAQVSEIVENFYVLGNITGRGANVAVGRQEAGIHWSARGNPLSWPAVATQAARDVLSDFHVFEGDGGPVTAIVAAEEYAVVFRQRQTWRMDYVGLPDIFRFRLMDAARGCIVEDGAVASGNNVYFPSDAGFLRFDGASVHPIGAEKVDRTWRDLSDRFLYRVVGIHFPTLRMILWLTPTDSASNAQLIYGYQYDTQKWTKVVPSFLAEWLLTVVSPTSGALDSLPFADQDMDDTVSGLGDVNLDTLGIVNAQPLLATFNSSHQLTFFRDEERPGSPGISPRLITGDYRDPGDRRLKLRSIRPHFRKADGGQSANDTTLAVVARASNVRNQPDWEPEATVADETNDLGLTPVRAHGRYIEAAFFLYDAVGELQGFEAKVDVGGAR